ncbi:MAG: hypothetical protein M1541_00470, partial [Acidobacteria bacterium]|nr:hypothetical protein [Acidobacteriota bacterium]
GRKPAAKILPGFGIAPHMAERDDPDPTWEWMNPGVRLKALPSTSRTISVPGARDGRYQYYRCSPGTRLAVELAARSEKPGPRAQIRCRVYDSAGQERAALAADEFALAQTAAPFRRTFEIPAAFKNRNIYLDPASDVELQVCFEVTITGLACDVTLERVQIALESGPPEMALMIDQRRAGAGKVAGLNGARHVIESLGHASWLIRETGLEWQVRNAACAMRDGWMEIDGVRNRFSARREVVIVPLAGRPACYVHRMRRVRAARILARPTVTIDLLDLYGAAEVELVSAARPAHVNGAENWTYRDGRVIVSRSSPGRIEVRHA